MDIVVFLPQKLKRGRIRFFLTQPCAYEVKSTAVS